MKISEMLNIQGKDIEDEIQKAIINVQRKLAGLDIERTCKIYSSYILRELLNRHIVAKLINTKNMDLNYEHEFVMATDGTNTYIIDLTYSQFKKSELEGLSKMGYIKCTKQVFYKYIYIINTLNSQKKK